MHATCALSPDQLPEEWDAVVDTYEESFEPFTAQIAADALALAPVTSGCRVLDIATGPGALVIEALETGAEVTAIDFSASMIERLRRRLDRDQRWRTLTLVMDGQRLELPDNLFHASFSIFGLIFFPDPLRGLREMHRTLRPGGRAVISTWSSPAKHEALQLILEVLCSVWPDFRSSTEPPAWMRFQDAKVVESAMTQAGFKSVAVHTVTRAWRMPSAQWFTERVARISPGTNYLFEAMPPSVAADFLSEMERRLFARFGEGPVEFSAEAHLAVGTKC